MSVILAQEDVCAWGMWQEETVDSASSVTSTCSQGWAVTGGLRLHTCLYSSIDLSNKHSQTLTFTTQFKSILLYRALTMDITETYK